jgi:hypothetical protein
MSSTKCFTDVFDADFKYFVELPTTSIRHLPPARLNITRLVLCRNHRPGEPESCAMGASCKFVHTDADVAAMEHHPIHVNYSWRSESLCTYERLPAGDVLRVHSANHVDPDEMIASERILVTRGALADNTVHCAQYKISRLCNRGERCNFVHVLHVDPTVQGEFKRAPGGKSAKSKLTVDEVATLQRQARLQKIADGGVTHDDSNVAESAGHCSDSDCCAERSSCCGSEHPPARYYRHNPYSLMKVTVWLE